MSVLPCRSAGREPDTSSGPVLPGRVDGWTPNHLPPVRGRRSCRGGPV